MQSISSMAEAEQKRITTEHRKKVEIFNKKLKALLLNPNAHDVFFEFLSWGNIYSDGFNPDNQKQQDYDAGMRGYGLRLLDKLEQADPEFYIKLLKERVRDAE